MSMLEHFVGQFEDAIVIWCADDSDPDAHREVGEARAALIEFYAAIDERADGIERMLKEARKAIASLDSDALGMGLSNHNPWSIRDELLSDIDAVLAEESRGVGALASPQTPATPEQEP